MTGTTTAEPAAVVDAPIAELEACLGHQFAQSALLERALTHASLSTGRKRRGRQVQSNNERLEFLGDRVLGLVIAHALIELYPDDAEGRLTDRLVALVKRDALAHVASNIELGRWLKLAAGEEGIGGRSNPGILADCLEALLGALYLDGGLGKAEAFIRIQWQKQLEQMREPPRDPKMALQEWAHANADSTPNYELVECTGPAHAPTFNVSVEIEDKGREIASANSKRAAEQAAAARLLHKLEDH